LKKRVYVAYTGGTIGMRRGRAGYQPVAGFLAEQLDRLPEIRGSGMPELVIQEYSPLLDSSNMTPLQWWRIAEDIRDHHADFDGFVVLHGTDTMAYTASALAFLLENLQKTVILTGAQIPLEAVRTDARENLITSILMAATLEVPEVCLYFGDKLLRGCRAVKVDAEGFDAFASPNLPPLATIGVQIDVDRELVQKVPSGPVRVQPLVEGSLDARVGSVRLFPGISAKFLRNVLSPPLQGLVLEAYGVGNGPDNNPALLEALVEASARGVVIVDRTQCLRGGVSLGDYATGNSLARAGAVPAFDMTFEATLTKLSWLVASGATPEEIRARITQNLRGELTHPEDESGRRWRLKKILV
jgi:L-asparaginase